MHLAGEAQDTPASSPRNRLGVDWLAQLVPFQCSANVKRPLWRKSPTAVQLPFAGQDTLPATVEPAPGGFGIGSACHPVLALAAAVPDSNAQITTAALTTTPFTGASQPSAVRLTGVLRANPTTTRRRCARRGVACRAS
jgi:hypothetical protein